MDWLPIELAPKDGTTVLLYVPNYRMQVAGGWWDNHPKCKCWIAGGYMQKSKPPKWWKPLGDLGNLPK